MVCILSLNTFILRFIHVILSIISFYCWVLFHCVLIHSPIATWNISNCWLLQIKIWWLLLFSHYVVSDFATLWTVACQNPLSMGFPRQEYWSGLPFPSPGDLSQQKIKPTSPAWPVDSLKDTVEEKEMAIHSSILAWKNPWTEESGGLKSMGLHDWACVHEGGGRWVGSKKLVELKKKKRLKKINKIYGGHLCKRFGWTHFFLSFG